MNTIKTSPLFTIWNWHAMTCVPLYSPSCPSLCFRLSFWFSGNISFPRSFSPLHRAARALFIGSYQPGIVCVNCLYMRANHFSASFTSIQQIIKLSLPLLKVKKTISFNLQWTFQSGIIGDAGSAAKRIVDLNCYNFVLKVHHVALI